MLTDPIEVIVRFDTDGQIVPLRFVAQGTAYPVDSTGRQWQDGDGLHILVMVAGGKVLELVFAAVELRWYLKQAVGRSSVA